MPKVIPFNGTRYNKENISGLICPPYDVISPEGKKNLLKKDEHNAVRIELPEKHILAREYFDKWKGEGVLSKDETPSFYLYEQKFSYAGKKYTRTGFFALLKTEKLGKNIFPHEKTHSGPKIDRFNLLKTTRINTSPIFCLFSDHNGVFQKIAEKTKRARLTAFANLKETSEKMWRLTDSKIVAAIEKLLSKNKLLIADGHHRYETFFNFTKGGNILVFLCPFEDAGLAIFPTHRLLSDWTGKDEKNLKKYFSAGKNWDFKFCTKNRIVKAKVLKGYGGLPIQYLHATILKNKELNYTKDEKEAVELIKKGKFAASVIVKPLDMKDLKLVMKKRLLLPQKSTYFYPKVSTGIVFNELD